MTWSWQALRLFRLLFYHKALLGIIKGSDVEIKLEWFFLRNDANHSCVCIFPEISCNCIYQYFMVLSVQFVNLKEAAQTNLRSYLHKTGTE